MDRQGKQGRRFSDDLRAWIEWLSREFAAGRRPYQTVVLENDYLRITFLPELGGKIHEVIDKTIGR